MSAGDYVWTDISYDRVNSASWERAALFHDYYLTRAGNTPNPANDTVIYCVSNGLTQPPVYTFSDSSHYWNWSVAGHAGNMLYYIEAAGMSYSWKVERVSRGTSGNQPYWHMVNGQPSTGVAGEDKEATGQLLEQILEFVLYNGYPTDATGYLAEGAFRDGVQYPGRNDSAVLNDDTHAQDRLRWVTQAVVQHYANGIDVLANPEANFLLTSSQRQAAADLIAATDAYVQSGCTTATGRFKVPPASTVLQWLHDQNADSGTQDFVWIEVPNTPTYEVCIDKFEEDGNTLSANRVKGAELGVYKATDTDFTNPLGGTFYTGDATQKVSGLEAGDYVLHEISAPQGYEAAGDVAFTINQDGSVTFTRPDGQRVTSGNQVAMYDKKTEQLFQLTVYKWLLTNGQESRADLRGKNITFALYQADSGYNYDANGAAYRTFSIDSYDASYGSYHVEGDLPAGYYVLVETNAPEDYTRSTPVQVHIHEDGRMDYYNTKDSSWHEGQFAGDCSAVVYNTYRPTFPLTVWKRLVDESGTITQPDLTADHITFDLFQADASFNYDPTSTPYRTFTIDAYDSGYGSYHYETGLPAGDYVLVERAHAKYKVFGTVNVHIDEGGYVTYRDLYYNSTIDSRDCAMVVYNQKVPDTTSVSVNKRWLNQDGSGLATDQMPEKVVVRLAGPNGEDLTGLKTPSGQEVPLTVELSAANSWTYTWKDLPMGSYGVDEVEVPAGFEKTVTAGGTVWTIANTKATRDLTVNKLGQVNPDSHEYKNAVAGVRFELWKEDENSATTLPGTSIKASKVGEAETGQDGLASFRELEYGTYYLLEVSVPSKYVRITTPLKVTLDKAGVNLPDCHEISYEYDANTDQVKVFNNLSSYELPETGGIGSYVPRIAGIVTIALALCVAAARDIRRREGSKG